MEEWTNYLLKNRKKIAEHNLAFFANYYLGLDTPEHQMDWYELLFKYPWEFLLSPRDHGKTTVLPRVIAEHHTLFQDEHRAKHHKDFNLLILSKTFSQSKKSVNVIKKDLTKNPRIKEDFQEELADYHGVGNILTYNERYGSRDGTVEGSGLLGDITGGHFWFIILDDIIDDANCRTPQAREEVTKWIGGTIVPLLEPGGRMLGIGTRKHYADAYSEMIKNPRWYVIQQKAILKYPDSYDVVYDENGMAVDITNIVGDYRVLWPSKWGIKRLLLQRLGMGSVLFAREYQNSTKEMVGKFLKDYWLKDYVINPDNAEPEHNLNIAPPRDSMKVYQGYDLAIRETEKADFVVCTTIGVTKNNKIYILDWYRDKIGFPEQVKLVKAKYNEWKPDLIGIETNQYQLALKQQVLSERILPIKEIVSIKNKTERIRVGSINYENGLVYVPIDHPQYDNFMEEYRVFDEAEHDDMLDSTDIAMKIILDPVVSVPFKRGMRSRSS